jgi:very-short-patch-repair endonuclease
MTRAERALWRMLREAFPHARFRSQVPIRHYIVDFASHSSRLIIEVDGGQHSDATDAGRTRLIQEEGYRVIRFWNNEVLGNPEGVWTVIDRALHDHHPHPASPIKGEEQRSAPPK